MRLLGLNAGSWRIAVRCSAQADPKPRCMSVDLMHLHSRATKLSRFFHMAAHT